MKIIPGTAFDPSSKSPFHLEYARTLDQNGDSRVTSLPSQALLPDQAPDEPFAAAIAASPTGTSIADPLASLSPSEHARFNQEIAQLQYAGGRGPKPPGRIGRIIISFFEN